MQRSNKKNFNNKNYRMISTGCMPEKPLGEGYHDHFLMKYLNYFNFCENDVKKDLTIDYGIQKKCDDYLEKFESVEYKPNRLVGFIKTNTSYHSIPKRELPKGITRDCFQINVWNLKTKRG